jgi:hypothetical protein
MIRIAVRQSTRSLRAGTVMPRRRGVAMLLVIITVMLASILTSAYLASRDNSALIGENAASAAAARWGADSGLNLGLAILQTETDWRASHVSGRLLSDYRLADGSIDLDLIDLETGMPPTASSERVRLTVTATVDGVSQLAVADCAVPLTDDPIADVDLSEFALFASERLMLKGEATIARWPMAPLTGQGERVMIGTRATGAASIDLADDSAAVDATVFHGPSASASLVTVTSGRRPEEVATQDLISLPASPAPGVAGPPTPSTAAALTQAGGSAITNTNMRWQSIAISSNATRTLRGNITVVADQDASITGDSKLVIDGQVKIVVFGDLTLDTGAIELRNGASLVMYLGGPSGSRLDISDGYIGNLRSNTVRDASGASPYMDPERVEIYSMPASAPGTWMISNNSVIKGSVYAPDVNVFQMTGQSAIYGRLATQNIQMGNDAAVFYDPSLNAHVGYTALDGSMYQADGRLKPEFRNIASLDAGLLQSLADTGNVVVRGLLGLLIKPTGYTPTRTDPGPTEPTPRPVKIEHTVRTIGVAVASWE